MILLTMRRILAGLAVTLVSRAVDAKTFGIRLAELRERAGLSQADVVRRTDKFRQSHYSTWERGVCAPNAIMLQHIAVALDCEQWELLEDPTPGFTPTLSKYQTTKNRNK
jgi:transcriptional regulator with XRE-family HTH domain